MNLESSQPELTKKNSLGLHFNSRLKEIVETTSPGDLRMQKFKELILEVEDSNPYLTENEKLSEISRLKYMLKDYES